jgi:hypothetical protein
LGLYAALLGPELPKFVKDLFTNTLFRILVLFLVVVRGNQDPKMAIMIAVAFVLTLDYIYVKNAKEAFSAVESFCNHSIPGGCPDNRLEGFCNHSIPGGCPDNRLEGFCTPKPPVVVCPSSSGSR